MDQLLQCQTPWPHRVVHPLCSTLQEEEPGEWGQWVRVKHQKGPVGGASWEILGMINRLDLKREGQVMPEALTAGQTNYPGTRPLSPCRRHI